MLLFQIPLANAQGQLLDSAALAKQKVYTSLEEALKEPEKVYKLDLFAKNLVTLPEMEQFVNLQELDISCNRLSVLPKGISKLKNLQRLIIGANIHHHFFDIPTRNLYEWKFYGRKVEIFSLSDSTLLNSLHNQLTALPNEIFSLTYLEVLDISNLPLLNFHDLFPKITNLKNLRCLYLTSNRITQMPNDIAQLTKLEVLDCYNNHISALPESIQEIKNLKIIDIGKNPNLKLVQTFNILSSCQNLIGLFLYENNFKEMPPSIRNLKKLKELDISNNRLTSIPNEIGELIEIRFLSLSKNHLDAFPTSIRNLKKLKELDISNNRLTSIPDEFGELIEIRFLSLSKNRLDALPTTIGNLTNLKELNLRQNHIKELPTALNNLWSLEYLDISNNELNKIKPIDKIPQLKYLDIYDNPLKDLSGFTNLMRLTSIGIDTNLLTAKQRFYFKDKITEFRVLVFRGYNVKFRRLGRRDIPTDEDKRGNEVFTNIYEYASHAPFFFSDNILEFEKAIEEKILLYPDYVNYFIKQRVRETPLTAAVKLKQVKIIKLLYELGADLNFKNSFGESALTISKDIIKENSINPISIFLANPTLYLPLLNQKIKQQDSLIFSSIASFSKFKHSIRKQKILYKLGVKKSNVNIFGHSPEELLLRNGQANEITYEPLKKRYAHLTDSTKLSDDEINYIYRLILEQYANHNLLKLDDEDWLDVGKQAQTNLPVADLPKPTTYHAFIVAVQDYQDDKLDLARPIADADSVVKTLTTFYQFAPQHITYLKNPTRDQIILAFDSLREALTENDNLLIFYAGHGNWDDKLQRGYWLPADASPSNRTRWFSYSDLKDYVSSFACKHALLVTDACFAGSLVLKDRNIDPAEKDIKAQLQEASPYIRKLYSKKSRKVMTSGAMQAVPDNSVFMKYLIKYLRNNSNKFLPASELFNEIRAAVINNSLKEPQFSPLSNTGDEGGEFIFIRKE